MSVYNAVPEGVLPLAEWFEKHTATKLRGVRFVRDGYFHLDFAREQAIPGVNVHRFAYPTAEWVLKDVDFVTEKQVFRVNYHRIGVAYICCNLHLAAYNLRRLAREEYPTVWDHLLEDDDG